MLHLWRGNQDRSYHFPTSIAMFRDINIDFKLQLGFFFFYSRHAVIDQIDWKHLVYEKLS